MSQPETKREFSVDALINSTGFLHKEVIAQIRKTSPRKVANPSMEEQDLDPPNDEDKVLDPLPTEDETPVFTGLPPQIMENRPKINAAEFLADFKASVEFKERDGRMQIVRDLIGMVRRLPHGVVETYEDKLKNEEDKGKSEAASYGIGRVDSQEFVLFATHWDFFAGTLGVVMGEKFVKATDLAVRKKLPFVAVFSSGGARQQENFPGLVQMPRMVNAIRNYKERTNLPYIAVLAQQVWGGISASSVPLADFTVALEGTNFGFSGPVVIETYEDKKVPQGAQSVEAHSLNRNVDFLVKDKDELLRWFEGLFALTSTRQRGLTEKDLEGFLHPGKVMSLSERFPFGKPRFLSLLRDEGLSEFPLDESSWGAVNTEDLYERFLALRNNPNRVDSEYLIRHCFEDVVPLYNGVISEDRIDYPAIIGAIGRIGRQPFLILGNQPSYQLFYEKVLKDPSSPAPSDLWWQQRTLKAAARWGLPAVFFTDTLGAKPILDAEVIGQFRAIAESIESGIKDNENPIITIITGVLGSGGGLSTAPMRDHVAMLENAMVFVAEPVSATSILYSQANPEVSLVRETIESMKPTATDQKELGLIDALINEPFGGSWMTPLATAAELRNHIGKTFLHLNNLRGRLSWGNRRIRHLRGLELKQ